MTNFDPTTNLVLLTDDLTNRITHQQCQVYNLELVWFETPFSVFIFYFF